MSCSCDLHTHHPPSPGHSSYWSIKWYGGRGRFDTPEKLICAHRPKEEHPPAGEPPLPVVPGRRGSRVDFKITLCCFDIVHLLSDKVLIFVRISRDRLGANVSQGPLTGDRSSQCRLRRPSTTGRGGGPAPAAVCTDQNPRRYKPRFGGRLHSGTSGLFIALVIQIPR